MGDPYPVSQAHDYSGLVASQHDPYPPVPVSVAVSVEQHELHAGLVATCPPYPSSSYHSATLAPPPHPAFYRQDSGATNSSSGATSSSDGSRSTLSSTPSDSLLYASGQAACDLYAAPTTYLPQHASSSNSPAHQLLPPPLPVPSTTPPGVSHLLQQHQANQQAFRLSQATSGPLVFAKYPAAAGSSAPDSRSSATSDATATSSSLAGPSSTRSPSSLSPSHAHAHPDGDFTQTFYDPFKVKHRRRTSAQQLKVLEHHFEFNPKPDLALRKALSEQLDMTPREVQVWFQNRRAKVKKLKERAEREAALSAASAATAAASADQPSYQPLLPHPPPAQPRTIYGSDVLAARRGSSPAVFSGLSGPSSSLPHNGAFLPSTTSQPFLPLPPPPNGFVGSGSSAYPSPVSLGAQSATPSPNNFVSHPPPAELAMQGGGYMDAVPSSSAFQPQAGLSARRFSLPAHPSCPPPPLPPHQTHSYGPIPTSQDPPSGYYPSIPLRPATATAAATDPSLSPSSASSLGGGPAGQSAWEQGVYAVDPHGQQQQVYVPPPQGKRTSFVPPADEPPTYHAQQQAGWSTDYSLDPASAPAPATVPGVDGYAYSSAARRGSMMGGAALPAIAEQYQHSKPA
ncbi:proteophosphoglycan 5 [Rhodotorula toruloides]|uniref:Proteophosphoglycan 5 n=1 Tax=Rhodotorula toruloides TaxID=5286 RepID=A0A511KC56_RHOTO|nr:proteophosphoglycan 5 [Rhodotorula toruloides]